MHTSSRYLLKSFSPQGRFFMLSWFALNAASCFPPHCLDYLTVYTVLGRRWTPALRLCRFVPMSILSVHSSLGNCFPDPFVCLALSTEPHTIPTPEMSSLPPLGNGQGCKLFFSIDFMHMCRTVRAPCACVALRLYPRIPELELTGSCEQFPVLGTEPRPSARAASALYC